ncbi:MAG: hypothetical protein NT067_00865 [Candidatus Diapherotrites archaeon]|nr:hypothetical protein [Candidatus Diapherotrites archaeon]
MPVPRKIFMGTLADMRQKKIDSLKRQMKKGTIGRPEAKKHLDSFTEKCLQKLMKINGVPRTEYATDLEGKTIEQRKAIVDFLSPKRGSLEHLLRTDPFGIEELYLRQMDQRTQVADVLEKGLKDQLFIAKSGECRINDGLNQIIEHADALSRSQANDFNNMISMKIWDVRVAITADAAATNTKNAIIDFLGRSEKRTAGDRRKAVRAMLKRMKELPETGSKLEELRSALADALDRFWAKRREAEQKRMN